MKAVITIGGFTFFDVELPDADTPLPDDSVNATIHILLEDNRPTSSSVFCGFTTQPLGKWPKGHKWVGLSEAHWHKHVNCPECQKAIRREQEATKP